MEPYSQKIEAKHQQNNEVKFSAKICELMLMFLLIFPYPVCEYSVTMDK